MIPSNWATVDINANPGTVNRLRNTAKIPPAYNDRDSLVVRSFGRTLYGSSDSCNFTYGVLNSDFVEIEVRVGRTEPTGDAAEAGVMFRESTAANAPYIALLVNSNGQLHLRERAQPGQDSVLTNDGGDYDNAYPIWLRLDRMGNNFTALKSLDGRNWTTVFTRTIPMQSPPLLGLVTVGSDTIPNKAFYDNLIMIGSTY